MKYFNLFIFLFLLTSTSLSAARNAVVSAQKAVIYSDFKMDSPIGYVRGGKVIKVGDRPRMKGAILPVIVSGRVAYIKAKDVRVLEDEDDVYSPKITEHNIDNSEFQQKDSLKENNHIIIQLGQFSLGDEWKKLTETAQSSNSSMTYYSIMLEHRPLHNSISFGVGGSFYSATGSNLKATAISLDGQIYWSPLKFSLFSIDLLFAGLVSFDTRIEVLNVTGVSAGNFYGWYFGPQVRLLPDKKLGFVGSLGYKRITVSGIKEIIFDDNTSSELNLLSGISAHVGMSYKF